MVESLIAVFLTIIAIVALMPMQDMSLRTAAKSDYYGRAVGILQTELERQQAFIMTPSNSVAIGETTNTVKVSDQSGVAGDMGFTVTTKITNNPSAPAANMSWIINVHVTWPRNSKGIRSSIIATRQSGFE